MLCFDLWVDASAPALQTLNLLGTLGYMVAPALASPFLGSKMTSGDASTDNTSLIYNDTELIQSCHSDANGTNTFCKVEINYNNSISSSPSSIRPLFYPYMISAFITLLASVSLLVSVLHMRSRNESTQDTNNKQEDEEKTEDSTKTSVIFHRTISVLFFVFNIFYGGIEVGYAGLLTTFAVKKLHWTEQQGNNAVILLQLTNCIGTAIAIFISQRIHPRTILIASIFLVDASLIVLCLFVQSEPMIVWTCTAFLGLGYATVMPCSYSWVEKLISVDGTFSSAYWSGFFVGFMAVPATMGYMFNIIPMSMPYISLLCAGCMTILFIVILIYAYVKRKEMVNNADQPSNLKI